MGSRKALFLLPPEFADSAFCLRLHVVFSVRPEASADGGARTRERLRGRLTKGCFCSPVLLTRSSVEPWKIRS
ncbi:hypothetical protein LEMLEM_LOCUS27687 [Lemmus lemmus]